MGTPKLCACDRTCQSPICAEIETIDTVKKPFAVLVKSLAEVEKTGLWLNPFRGIPRGPRLSRFDVIYLDENCQVLDFAENFTEAEFKPFQGDATTALVLPPHTLNSLKIRKGDQLRICSGDKLLAPSGELASSKVHDRSQCVLDSGQGISPSEPTVCKQPSAIEADMSDLAEEKPSLKLRLLRWLFQVPASTDQRRGERRPAPDLIAYYWNGGTPKAHQLGNVSQSGLYLLTEERWLPGTCFVMTLQKKRDSEITTEEISRVESRVVRWGDDGIGFEFVRSGFVDLNSGEVVDRKFDQQAFTQFLRS